MKGDTSRGSKSTGLRSVLVVFQFTTSIMLIIGAIVVNSQMNYILNTNVGFDKEQVLIVQGTNTLENKQEAFKNELLKLPSIESVSYSSFLPIAGTKRDQNDFWIDGQQREVEGIGTQIWNVDEDYIQTLGIQIIEGKNLNPDLESEKQIIINQALIDKLGLKEPLGALISNREDRPYRVVGIIEDFHYESLRQKVWPLAFRLNQGGSVAAVRFNPENIDKTMAEVSSIWEQFAPNQSIRFSFLSERFASMYEDVQRTSRIFNIFSILAIFVACTGLFALSGFMAEQRRKEISIRKVLGASVQNIFRLLASNFVKLIVISFVIASAIGYPLMQQWLANFEYGIELSWFIILLAGLIGLAIALITISFESLKAGYQDPVDGLRSE